MLVMVGASASGKTEIAKIIIRKYGFEKMITYTTRPKRVGEVEGIDYHFLNKEEFIQKMVNNEFLETTTYNNNYYGTAFKDASFKKVLIVDTNGANILYSSLKNNVKLFFLEAPKDVRTQRMINRGDNPEEIKKRLNGDDTFFDLKNLDHIDYVINTNNCGLEELADKIYQLYIK